MSRTQIHDRLSDIDERVVADAEADLDRLLSLEPSPEFAARVLARIKAPHAARGPLPRDGHARGAAAARELPRALRVLDQGRP